MKSYLLRLMTAGLCVLLILSSLVSCANTDGSNITSDTETSAKEDETPPTFVNEDYKGATFTILSEQDEATDFRDHYIDASEITGEPINDSVFERNSLVEAKYNVDIVRKKGNVAYADTSIKSGTVDFDLVYDWGIRLVPVALEGAFCDFNQVPVINQNQSYWAPSSQDDLTIAGKMLITTCDISMNRISWAYFLFFNKRIMDDLHYEYPYSYVMSNTWTIDTFLGMVVGSEMDDGDTIWTTKDRYGYIGSESDCIEDLVNAIGENSTVKNEDGSYTLNVYNETMTSVYSKYHKKMQTSGAFADFSNTEWTNGMDISKFDSIYKAARYASFGEGHSLFARYTMDIAVELSSMSDTYGVVPMPKYDSSQKEYYHIIDSCAPMFAIPKTSDTEYVGTIMEYMAYESSNLLLPAFYEQTIKIKNMNDKEGRDETMLDIIRDSVHYSWTDLYYQEIFKDDGGTWDPCKTIRHEMLASGNFASVYRKYKNAAEVSIDTIHQRISEMDLTK